MLVYRRRVGEVFERFVGLGGCQPQWLAEGLRLLTAKRALRGIGTGHFFANLVDFLLDRQFTEARKRQAQQQADASIEYVEGIAKGTVYSLWRPFDGSRIGNAPMRGHRRE